MLGAVLTPLFALFGNKARDYGAVLFSLAAAVFAALMVPDAVAGRTADLQYNWIPSIGFKAGVLVDPISVLLANVVAWISFLIMVYSIGYMRGEKGLTRYWFFMNFFIGNMLLLVMSDNLLQLMFGWEGVGLCSYALIGFYYDDNPDRWVGSPGHVAAGVPMSYSPSHAGMKAFVMTRIGDIGLLISIFLIYSYAGTLNYLELTVRLDWAGDLARAGLLLPAAVLFFVGPIGKSAQLPLHEWLPDAMAGPTAVSALIHAATMVKAGVFLIVRAGPIFYAALLEFGGVTVFFEVIAWTGALTAFIAASQAVVAKEIKKVLAYSTLSQIGYMMLAVGAGGLAAQFVVGSVAGLFHLVSHAIFKAAMFLAAGAVIHACESRFMDDMGGLKGSMPLTFLAMMLAMFSLMGVPPFSGFWSKDAVLAATFESGQLALFALGLVTIILTAWYGIRLLGMVFLGNKSANLRHHEERHGAVREAPKVMLVPYALLAVGSLVIGLGGPWFEGFLETFIGGEHTELAMSASAAEPGSLSFASFLVPALGIVMLAVGVLPGYLVYVRKAVNAESVLSKYGGLRSVYDFLWNRWYLNVVYYRVFAYGTQRIADLLWAILERGVFDRISGAFAGLGVGLSKFSDTLDVRGVDGIINGIARAGKTISGGLKRIQTGVPQQYLLVFVIGLFALVLYLLGLV
jgi:NADH-quinone oxidoreductase subunit L